MCGLNNFLYRFSKNDDETSETNKTNVSPFAQQMGRNEVNATYSEKTRNDFRKLYFTNLTMQSMQIGFFVKASINTLAGCMSSKAKRSEI